MINFPCIEILSSITEEGAIIIKLKSLSLFNLRDPPGFKLGAIRYSVAWFPHAKAEVVVSLFVAFSLTSSSSFFFEIIYLPFLQIQYEALFFFDGIGMKH